MLSAGVGQTGRLLGRMYFNMHEQVKLAFDREGITIPFPQRDVHMIPGSQNRLDPLTTFFPEPQYSFEGSRDLVTEEFPLDFMKYHRTITD